MIKQLAFALSLAIIPLVIYAGDVAVVDVHVSKADATHYDFDVTLKHADSGWDHYADKWEVRGPDGKVYGTRVLLHPHEDEQPFTRSLEKVAIPAAVKEVTIRAHAKPHGYGGITKTVKLP
jgi:hypothetical protein